jgi:hypothetical protein
MFLALELAKAALSRLQRFEMAIRLVPPGLFSIALTI